MSSVHMLWRVMRTMWGTVPAANWGVGLKQLRSGADVVNALQQSVHRPLLVFKHSTKCGISSAAHRQWQRFLTMSEARGLDHAWIRVVEERPAAQDFAQRVGVAHGSPQVVLVKGGRAVWHATGDGITADRIRRAVGGD